MDDRSVNAQATEDFNKARIKEVITSLMNLMQPARKELLSLNDIKSIIKPFGEKYLGMQIVPLKYILGSEDRYHDFDKTFLPRHGRLRQRWENIDRAHLRFISLPPIKLFKVGEIYFVRDGNHRVSVARSQKVETIDAEVVELTSDMHLDGNTTREDLLNQIIAFEKKQFLQETKLNEHFDQLDLDFSSPGRFDEIIKHIYGHRYYINQDSDDEIPFSDAAFSWYTLVYQPAADAITRQRILNYFPGRTIGDMYLWLISHWDQLKKKYGENVSIEEAAKDYRSKYGMDFLDKIGIMLRRLFSKDNQ